MSYLISCQNLTKSFSAKPLITDLTLGIGERDHIGMIGPNGSGKSTLLKILAGLEKPDGGIVASAKNLHAAYLSQQDPFTGEETVESVLNKAQEDLHLEDYERDTEVAIMMGKLGFEDPNAIIKTLSGGWRKRLAIACKLIRKPDLLLLDEPTNHLDIEGILWLEKTLRSLRSAYLVVSHDRYFLENISARVVELNPRYPLGHFSAAGKYSEFLVKREEFFTNELKQQQTLANLVRREIDWLQHGPKARTTKSSARIKQAHAMIEDLGEMKSRSSLNQAARIDFSASERMTKKLIAAKNISVERGGRTLIEDLTLLLGPGMRLGLLGLNGSGKTSLIDTLIGKTPPAKGSVDTADHLQMAFLDQQRLVPDNRLTLGKALASSGDQVIYRGRAMHVASWAKRFLFNPEQLSLPIANLSGGEKARILIARLMLQPADLLVLDEPTNDLDIPTLEVLEESLTDFPGAVILVTHDRYLLDRVSTHLLALDGNGTAEFYADFAQWEEAQLAEPQLQSGGGKKNTDTEVAKETPADKPRRLSYKEQKEWDTMEASILKAEQKIGLCEKEIEDPTVASNAVHLQQACERLKAAQTEAETLYKRWAELEALKK